MTASGRWHAASRWHVAPSVWPTLVGAGAAFGLAAHERLVWPQILGCVLLALVVTSLLVVAIPARFEIGVEVPARVRVGEPFDTTVRLTNRGGHRRDVVVRQRWRSPRPLVCEIVAFAGVVNGHAQTAATALRTPIARGAAETCEVEIEVNGPFGFFSRTMTHAIRRGLVSLPRATAPLEFIAGQAFLLAGQDFRAGAVAGSTTDDDVRGVRDWRTGDQISQVHWRSVVRTGRMTVVERGGHSRGTLTIVVVAPGKRGRPVKDATFEAALATAAATAVTAHRHGIPTCFVAQARNSGVASGVAHPTDEVSLLECFGRVAVAAPAGDALLEHALSHAARGGTLLVVASRATPDAWRARLFAAAAEAGAVAVDVRSVVSGNAEALSVPA